MKKVLLGLLLSAVVSMAYSGPVEQSRAYRAALNFISAHSPGGLRNSGDLQLVYTGQNRTDTLLRASEVPLFYVYNVSGEGGFVIISGDDAISPVIGYAGQGSFGTGELPPNLKSWLAHYEKELSYVQSNGYTASEETERQWEKLVSGVPEVTANVVLLPTADWDQLEPYNDLCPYDQGMRSVSGCVATAMGILMHYHQWPEKGEGKNSYNTTTKKYAVSADFNVSYDWGNMLDTYAKKSSGIPQWNMVQGKAVATLIYHCGVASYMDYTSDASGASQRDMAGALIDHFGYDKSMYLAYRDLYSKGEWHNLIRRELEEGRIVLYGGVSDKQEGHEFIVDGYNSSDYYHINWGWNGYSNGFYLLSSLEPHWQGTGGSREGAGFSLEQDALVNIKKRVRNSSANHEFYYPKSDRFDFWGLKTDVEMITPGTPFKISFSYVLDYGGREFAGGLWGLFVTDKNDNRKSELEIFSFDLGANSAMYNDIGDTYVISSEIAEGDKIRLFYTSDRTNWKPVRGVSGAATELPVGIPLSTATEHPALVKNSTVFCTKDGTVLQIRSVETIQDIKLYDLSGRLVKEQKPLSGETSARLHIAHLQTGAYVVVIETAQGKETHKIIK